MSKIINLLPQPRQQEIRYQNILGAAIQAIIFSLMSFAVVFLAQFGAKLFLAQQARATASEIQQLTAQVNKEDNEKIKGEIKQINGTISDYLALSAQSPKWSKVLRAFAKLPPEDVRIVNFTVDSATKMVNIVGVSPSRESMIQLYNNIKADENEFYNVDYPLENVIKPENVNFHFSFYIKDQLLK